MDKPARLGSQPRGQLLRAPSDGLRIIGMPEHEVDGVESRVSMTGRWIDRHQTTMPAAVKNIRRGQVAVEKNGAGHRLVVG